MRSGDRVATGTGAARRRLTVAEAEAGGLPDRFTPAEWEAMRNAAATLTHPIFITYATDGQLLFESPR